MTYFKSPNDFGYIHNNLYVYRILNGHKNIPISFHKIKCYLIIKFSFIHKI